MRTALFRPGDRPLLHLGLLLATLATTFFAFFVTFGAGPGATLSEQARAALTFSFSLVSILGAHEMGHYVLARRHGVDSTLPYFIPLPLPPIGTLGAVIRLRGHMPNKNALVAIGAAGPLAGLAVAVPLLAYGLFHSPVVDAPVLAKRFPGEDSLWVLLPQAWEYLSGWISGAARPPPAPVRTTFVFGNNLLMLGMQRLIVGELAPGKDVYAHPTVIASWFGLLVTMLNLVPIGQLDGGHLTFALFGKRARALGKLVAALLFMLCLFFSASWLVWLLVSTLVIGFRHPEVLDPQEPLNPRGRLICALCLSAFVLCVMPVPLSQVSVP